MEKCRGDVMSGEWLRVISRSERRALHSGSGKTPLWPDLLSGRSFPW